MTCIIAMPAWAGPKTATDKVVDTFMELDSDADESVSFGEYKTMVNQRARARFRQMDRNHNGAVSSDEYRNFWRQQKAKWYRLKR
ncbi:MAG: thymidylate synthase [Mariprofundus sp.]|nr:thymidylate synthase [Mariprofundus sp.]